MILPLKLVDEVSDFFIDIIIGNQLICNIADSGDGDPFSSMLSTMHDNGHILGLHAFLIRFLGISSFDGDSENISSFMTFADIDNLDEFWPQCFKETHPLIDSLVVLIIVEEEFTQIVN